MKLSIIIPCYNGAKTLAAQLDALAEQTWDQPWELILADNGSSDNSRAIAERYTGKISNLQILDASAKRGASYARNVGVAAAQAEAVVFVDADDVVAPGWLATIGEALQQHQAVASAFDYTQLNSQKEQEYMKGNQAADLQQLWYPPYAYHAGGCGLGVHKSVHHAIGGFDEALRRLQDTDYCLRIQQRGIELKFIPKALIYIRNSESWQGVFYQGRSWAKYNTWLYKRYRGPDRIPRAWRKYWLDWFKLARRLIRQGPTYKVVFQLGWQVGLMQGSILYRSDPAVVTGNKLTPKLPTSTTFIPSTHYEHQSAKNPQVHP
ncbi:MAG: glycosyltransferase [Anaerolineaceae bacterium]|nr:glycosyltransferase [Anaerolineaceae bacterium]